MRLYFLWLVALVNVPTMFLCQALANGTIQLSEPTHEECLVFLQGLKVSMKDFRFVAPGKAGIDVASPTIVWGAKRNSIEGLKGKSLIVLFTEASLHNLEKIPKSSIVFVMDIKFRDKIGLVRRLFPRPARIGVLTSDKEIFKESKNYSAVLAQYVVGPGEVPLSFRALIDRIDVFLAIPDQVVFNYYSTLFLLRECALSGIPVIGFSEDMFEYGALASYRIDFYREGMRMGRIFKNFLLNRCHGGVVFFPKNYRIIKRDDH
ncbi:ABC transporter substrate binding protein [Dissulfuribacter thermophilus]|nr:ABC transporter substrate binding protein [Dissulfuribacter thermophilus]